MVPPVLVYRMAVIITLTDHMFVKFPNNSDSRVNDWTISEGWIINLHQKKKIAMAFSDN